MKENLKLYWKLFTSTFYISAFTFGGGYVIVPLMKKKFVEELQWIDEDEMLDLIALAQASPGAIAINTSIAIGYKVGKTKGVITAILAAILPPFVIICIITVFYQWFRDNEIVSAALKGMNAGVAAVISDVCISMASVYFKKRQTVSIIVMIAAFLLVFIFDINAILVIITFALIGGLTAVYKMRKEKTL